MHAYQGIALRTAYLIAGNAADAEEAAQDGFVKAHRALWRFRTGASFKPWLLQIVANEARNRRRSAGRRAQLALRAAGEAASGDAAPSPEAALLGSERREELLAALNRLSEPDRETLACRFFLDLSEAETAATLGIRPGTVKSRRLARVGAPADRAGRGGGGMTERELQALAAYVDFPAERDLASAVRARLDARSPAAGARSCSSSPRRCLPSRSPLPSRRRGPGSCASSTCRA